MDNWPNRDNPLQAKSYGFALQIIELYRSLSSEHREYVLSRQILRCGTSIGANIAEANQAQSRPDFISKLAIALKEAVETEYWISLLRDARYLTPEDAQALIADCKELTRMLTAAIKTSKARQPS
jgi:four helix bundle protein